MYDMLPFVGALSLQAPPQLHFTHHLHHVRKAGAPVTPPSFLACLFAGVVPKLGAKDRSLPVSAVCRVLEADHSCTTVSDIGAVPFGLKSLPPYAFGLFEVRLVLIILIVLTSTQCLSLMFRFLANNACLGRVFWCETASLEVLMRHVSLRASVIQERRDFACVCRASTCFGCIACGTTLILALTKSKSLAVP